MPARIKCSSLRVLRAFVVNLFSCRSSWFLAALAIVIPASARAVEYAQLAKYRTADAQHVPYRAIVTPGREHGERLPLVVFLHGDWQDGDDNEAQLAGYGNGSLELVDRAIEGNIPLVYIAPQTSGGYWPSRCRLLSGTTPDATRPFASS